jgi:hypothetical protein
VTDALSILKNVKILIFAEDTRCQTGSQWHGQAGLEASAKKYPATPGAQENE